MMELREHFINTFVEEVNHLNGTDFEQMCRWVMELVTGGEVELKGHNLFLKPVRGSVDLISDEDYHEVGQCGTDENYFASSKPTDDIDSALHNSQTAQTVYLFCNRRAKGSELANTQERCTNHKAGIKAPIYDSQKIAKVVYDNIVSTKQVKEILSYLPKTFDYYLLMPQSNTLPTYSSSYVSRPEEKQVEELLQNNDVVQIHGLSGIGKSYLSIAIANNIGNQYATVLWIDGDNTIVDELKNVHVRSIGQTINLYSVLQRLKVLLIVDNLNHDVAKFSKSFLDANTKGSKCIITSLEEAYGLACHYELKNVDEERTRKILLETDVPPTKEQTEVLTKQLGGFPLIIDIAKKAVESGNFTWDEIISASNITELQDTERNEEFAKRIIGRYVGKQSDMFNSILHFGHTTISYEYLYEQSNFKLKELQRCSVLQRTGDHTCFVHSIVFDAIRCMMEGRADENQHKITLLNYLRKHVVARDSGLYTFMAIHSNNLQALANKLSPDDELRHFIVLATCYTQDTFVDLDSSIGQIEKLTLDHSQRAIDLNLLIEKLEMVQRKEHTNEAIENTIHQLEELQVANDTEKALVEHHIGKSYSILKNVEEAKKHLYEAIRLNPDAFNSMLSLARLYNKKEEREQISAMVDRIMAPETIDKVPVSILLSVYGLIATSKNDSLRKKYVDGGLGRFCDVIDSSLSKDYSQTYLVLSMLSGGLSFRFPDVYNRLCARLPMPLSKDKNSQQSKNYGKILANQYRYAMQDGEARKEVYERVLKCLEGNPDDTDYDRKALMDFYNAAGEPDKAIALAEQFENTEDIFLYQSLCKAYRIKKDYDTAFAMIDRSIAGEEEKTFAGHKAAFRHDKALCLLALNRREEAINMQKEAIALQTDNKSKAEWEEELCSWQ